MTVIPQSQEFHFFENFKIIGEKGPVKLIQWVKIAHSFLHVMSKLFDLIIFSLSG